MLWIAYAGLSGSIVVSLAAVSLILGMPVEGIGRIVGLTGATFAGFGVAVYASLFFMARPRPPFGSTADALMVGPKDRVIPPPQQQAARRSGLKFASLLSGRPARRSSTA